MWAQNCLGLDTSAQEYIFDVRLNFRNMMYDEESWLNMICHKAPQFFKFLAAHMDIGPPNLGMGWVRLVGTIREDQQTSINRVSVPQSPRFVS